jgi:hypothetical protein
MSKMLLAIAQVWTSKYLAWKVSLKMSYRLTTNVSSHSSIKQKLSGVLPPEMLAQARLVEQVQPRSQNSNLLLISRNA